METFEAQGLWWLPEHEDHRVPGILTWDPQRGGSLKLVGQMRPIVLLTNESPDGRVQKYRDRSRDDDKSYPVLHGQAEKTAFTLIGCFQQSRRDWSLDQSSEEVHVNSVMEGAFFETPDLEVDRAVVSLRDLAEWVNLSGIDITYPSSDGDGDEFAVVSTRRMADVPVPFGGAGIRLSQSLGTTREGNVGAGIAQDWALVVERDEVAASRYFLDVAGSVQDLVSIGTGRTAEFRDVVFHHPHLPQLSLAGTPMGNLRQDLKFHARWSNRADFDSSAQSERKPVSTHDMYFLLDQVGPDGLGRWLEMAEMYKTEIGRAMATRYSKGYLEDRIMNVCAALESFDKQRRGVSDEWYVDRVVACVDLAGDPFKELISGDPRVWAERVRDLRNDLAHHRERFRLDGTVGGHLVAEQLYWLFALCVLRAADMPSAVFESIARHGQWRWLQARAAEAAS